MSVFLVADDQFGLLTAQTVSGHPPARRILVIPLVFVPSLLTGLGRVRDLLERVHGRARLSAPFVMPPVIVVIENNFAYGAAVYQQLLWFARHRQPTTQPTLDIVFATPVYGLNEYLTDRWTRLRRTRLELREMQRHDGGTVAHDDRLWQEVCMQEVLRDPETQRNPAALRRLVTTLAHVKHTLRFCVGCCRTLRVSGPRNNPREIRWPA